MKEWIHKIRGCKKEQILILLLFGVLLLVIAIPVETPEEGMEVQTEAVAAAAEAVSDTEVLEEKLKAILSQVAGIGKTEVMITLKSGGREIVEKDMEQQEGKEESGTDGGGTSSQKNVSESTVYQRDAQGNEIPYVTQTLEPEIEGVLVIAQGGGNSVVAGEITEAVMALFGVEAHKIKVMKME